MLVTPAFPDERILFRPESRAETVQFREMTGDSFNVGLESLQLADQGPML
jgi:hypothetical protein